MLNFSEFLNTVSFFHITKWWGDYQHFPCNDSRDFWESHQFYVDVKAELDNQSFSLEVRCILFKKNFGHVF